jgi:asparagine synthase (glutamine-hydrolysing)
MSIYVISEMERGKVRRIYGSSRYPSIHKGNIFMDFSGDVNLSHADSLPLTIRDFYSIVAIRPSHILISRDVLGGRPLYYDPENVSISSFRDVLEFPVELNPGEVIKLDYNGDVLERRVFSFENVFEIHNHDGDGANRDEDYLKEFIIKRLESYKARGCVAYSGGLDSSVLAKIYDLELISVTANPKEQEWLEKSGKAIGKNVEINKFGVEDV